LAWMGVSKKPLEIKHAHHIPDFAYEEENLLYHIGNIKPNCSEEEYASCIKKIKNYLEEGLSYQVNFTFKVNFNFQGSVLDFYLALRRAQPTSYMALINTGDNFILSLSPELFFRIKKSKIFSRPMKGTISRGLTFLDDRENKKHLKTDKKIRAENLMIVDLLRNDLGRIAKKVWVPKLFAVEQYRTLNQMTSTISATLKENIKIKDIFTALFPCGSVTGAPKIKTMQIIKTLEKEPRGIYTGAIGYISPKKGACFNVAIRTVALSGKKGEMGIGGGIVYDSIEKCEYREALLKAKFLIEKFPSFSLIESILWDNGYFLLGLHLRRLRKSADYFSVPLDLKKLKNDLRILGKSLNGEKFKIMVLVNLEGQIYIKKEELNQVKLPVKVKISTQRINPRNVFLYHKTTQRDLYEKERLKAQQEGFFEVIFLNTNEELTEGSISNVFLKKDKFLYTPPVKCGLLPGVLRAKLLKGGKAKEKTVTLNDLLAADKIYIGNSVRGLLYAQISLADTKNKSKIKMQRITFVGKI